MTEGPIQTETREGIFTIRFNRPEKKNALSQAMYTAAADGLRLADGDDSVRVILLSGSHDGRADSNRNARGDLYHTLQPAGKEECLEPGHVHCCGRWTQAGRWR